jgi:hypothetical protein
VDVFFLIAAQRWNQFEAEVGGSTGLPLVGRRHRLRSVDLEFTMQGQ